MKNSVKAGLTLIWAEVCYFNLLIPNVVKRFKWDLGFWCNVLWPLIALYTVSRTDSEDMRIFLLCAVFFHFGFHVSKYLEYRRYFILKAFNGDKETNIRRYKKLLRSGGLFSRIDKHD